MNKRTPSDEWLTPPEIVQALGEFDLDPCAPLYRPWPTARHHFTLEDDGLQQPWFGRVWMNPPYGRELVRWYRKLSHYGNGIGIAFARTDTVTFTNYVFPKADSIFFIAGRLSFHTVAGTKSRIKAMSPSVLISYGERNADALADSGLRGRHVPLNYIPVIVVGVSPSWKSVVSITLNRLNGQAHLSEIYDLIEQLAPDKVQQNAFFKEKVRQTLQMHFERIGKGIYRNG